MILRPSSAAPQLRKDPIRIPRSKVPVAMPGETPGHRTLVVVLCFVYIYLLALAHGYRMGRMAHRKSRLFFSDTLVLIQGLVSTAFLFAIGISSAGLGLSTDGQCYNAIRVCIVMYGVAKMTLYLFLLERIRIVRAPFMDRMKDPIWVTGSVFIVGGWIAIMGCEFISPYASLSQQDGSCTIKLDRAFGEIGIAIDVFINLVLTAIFIVQSRPAKGFIAHWPAIHRSTKRVERASTPSATSSQRNWRSMLIRNCVGSTICLIVTVTTCGLLLSQDFAHRSHACLLLCLTDVVTGMLVTNWLSMRSAPKEPDVARSYSDLTSTQSGYSRIYTFGDGVPSNTNEKPTSNRDVQSNPQNI